MTMHLERMRDGAAKRIAAAAVPHLRDGEIVRRALWATNTGTRSRAIIGEMILGKVKYFTIVATDEHIVVFRRGVWQTARILGAVREYPIRGTAVSLKKGWGELSIGDDRYWTSSLAGLGDAIRFVDFVESVGGRDLQLQ